MSYGLTSQAVITSDSYQEPFYDLIYQKKKEKEKGSLATLWDVTSGTVVLPATVRAHFQAPLSIRWETHIHTPQNSLHFSKCLSFSQTLWLNRFLESPSNSNSLACGLLLKFFCSRVRDFTWVKFLEGNLSPYIAGSSVEQCLHLCHHPYVD